jgi:protein-L-isoaspartate(D-aspartate) O-methyltransferase
MGAGPWLLAEDGEPTQSSDPAIVYQDMAMGLLPERGITTGLPSLHARCIGACALSAGETVIHVGAGAGYYTAILAELVGPSGRVTAFEIDEALAGRARESLRDWTNVSIEHRSGTELPNAEADIIYVCAGVQQLPRAWLDSLRCGGRLCVPLTPGAGEGGVLLIRRLQSGAWSARIVCTARFVPCVGAQDSEVVDALSAAFRGGGLDTVRSLHRSPEPPEASCWYAGSDWWLSTREVD